MRAYLIEDILQDNAAKIAETLDERGFKGPIEDIWYLPVPEEMLTDEQKEHLDDCGPYFMALERIDRIDHDDFKLELLVRARKRMRCSCVCYATPAQREYMMDYFDDFIRGLDIPV